MDTNSLAAKMRKMRKPGFGLWLAAPKLSGEGGTLDWFLQALYRKPPKNPSTPALLKKCKAKLL
jgi:hypothetical protein